MKATGAPLRVASGAALLFPFIISAQSWNCSGGSCTTPAPVGIGMSSAPYGQLQVSGLTAESSVRVTSNSAADVAGLIYTVPSIQDWSVGVRPSGNFVFSPSNIFYGNDSVTLQPNGNLGIGTSAPGKRMEISASDVSTSMGDTRAALLLRNTAGYLSRSAIDFYGNCCTSNVWRYAAIEGLVTGEGSGGDIGAILFGTKYSILDTTLTERMRIDALGHVGIGTSSPQYPLSVNGAIQAKEVLVNTGWSDYVFDQDYRLAPLTEVAEYVKRNRHLPDIPSAAEVQEKGVSIGEMQAKLLAKIEELTLHMVRAEQERSQLKDENRELRGRVAKLELGVR